MYTKTDLNADIFDVIGAMESDPVIDPRRVTAIVIHKHSPGIGDGETFAAYCQFRHTRDQVGKALSRLFRDTDLTTDAQMELYGSLHARYPCKREAIEQYPLREEMTLKERQKEVEKLEALGNAYLEHARQLNAETQALIRQGHFDATA